MTLTLLTMLACAPSGAHSESTSPLDGTPVELDAYRTSLSDQLDSPPESLEAWQDIVDGDEISVTPGRDRLYINMYMLGPVGMGYVGYTIETFSGEESLVYQEGSTEFDAFPDSATLGMRHVNWETPEGTEELLGDDLSIDVHVWDVEEPDAEGIVYLDHVVEGGVDETFSVTATAVNK